MKWLGHGFWYGDFAGFIGISVRVIGKKVGGICVFGPWLKEYEGVDPLKWIGAVTL